MTGFAKVAIASHENLATDASTASDSEELDYTLAPRMMKDVSDATEE